MKIKEKTEKKVFAYMEEHRMLAPGEKAVLGVSGGADSVCMFYLLLAYSKKIPLSLAAVHVNHCIRKEASEDARYVEELCRREGIPFFLTEADVRALALQEKCSEEDAGRRVRYDALGRAAEALGGAKLAVAHNSNDNAETMLFHLFRGSGIKGLGGIAPVGREPVSGNTIIRPLLCLERTEVEAYLGECGIKWCEDETNAGDDYGRNRIRHHILPYAQQELFGGVVGHMNRTAQFLRETEDFLEGQTREAMGECVRKEGEGVRYVVDIARFVSFHEVLQKRMLLTLAKSLSPTGKDIVSVHILDVMSLFEREGNRNIDLPFGIRAFRRYGNVVLECRGNTACQEAVPGEMAVEAEPGSSSVYVLEGEAWKDFLECICQDLFPGQEAAGGMKCAKIEFSLFSAKKSQEVPGNRYTKWFDYDKIKKCMTIRTRRRGDYLTMADGRGGVIHKSLKEYMIAEKIPRQLRDRIPVLAAGSHVLWLVGKRISEFFKVEESTSRILQVKLTGELCRGICENRKTEEKNVGTH